MSKRRVVITGLGMVTPVGNDCETSWQSMLDGKSGIDKISAFDATGYPSEIAGEVKSFNGQTHLTGKELRKMDRFIQLGMVAGIDAIRDSGLEIDESNADMAGVYIGAGIGGVGSIESTPKYCIRKAFEGSHHFIFL